MTFFCVIQLMSSVQKEWLRGVVFQEGCESVQEGNTTLGDCTNGQCNHSRSTNWACLGVFAVESFSICTKVYSRRRGREIWWYFCLQWISSYLFLLMIYIVSVYVHSLSLSLAFVHNPNDYIDTVLHSGQGAIEWYSLKCHLLLFVIGYFWSCGSLNDLNESIPRNISSSCFNPNYHTGVRVWHNLFVVSTCHNSYVNHRATQSCVYTKWMTSVVIQADTIFPHPPLHSDDLSIFSTWEHSSRQSCLFSPSFPLPLPLCHSPPSSLSFASTFHNLY